VCVDRLESRGLWRPGTDIGMLCWDIIDYGQNYVSETPCVLMVWKKEGYGGLALILECCVGILSIMDIKL